MRRKKHRRTLTYLAALALTGVLAALFFLNRSMPRKDPPPSLQKPSVGYKTEDRLKLEKLIHADAKND